MCDTAVIEVSKHDSGSYLHGLSLVEQGQANGLEGSDSNGR